MKELKEYDINEVTGFLPDECLPRLPATFNEWEDLLANARLLIEKDSFRSTIGKLPEFPYNNLIDQKHLRRAFVLISFLSQCYVWGNGKDDPGPASQLPAILANPWIRLSEELGLNPILCQASVVLWNWKKIDPHKSFNLDNIFTLNTCTGSMDESWFYLVTAAVEGVGGPILKDMIDLKKAMDDNDDGYVILKLKSLKDGLSKIIAILSRMKEKNDPNYFYFQVRPYLRGWDNSKRLPLGLLYGDEDKPRKYAGGSAAQSSLIQAYDCILNVSHCPQSRSNTDFLHQMRSYMPYKHRKFLEDIEKEPCLKTYVKKDRLLEKAYNEVLNELVNFRNKHIQMVASYITVPGSNCGNDVTGTGGTSAIPFLKQIRNETVDAIIPNK
ncbi:Indoleamine 2,3-dioxygenase [Rozella allomycis CSF55]|uniref:Indoleamine 2,3-dioxygenase n=1 Tax=Rozella allomycis (strain CSF55) TaxID=988480 RepID=A0A4P9YAG0_ROZAC|nr:Indoleamine 2,3-dioxygenase [Rozella allomycis CSF55]